METTRPFPPGFLWGTATSAWQIEGGHDADGKGPSIWDAFSRIPGRIRDGDTGDVACDHYHRFREDVALIRDLGFKAYRFSISWPRLLPAGSIHRGSINEDGVRFYSELIDLLLENGIEPWVTLYHWDLPLALQFESDGWLGPATVDAFVAYADLCFDRFGGRVKRWITFNEPWVTAVYGHGMGTMAPGRFSNKEPYTAGHHQLLAHARAVALYRQRYAHQQGMIGITNNCDWREPRSNAPGDRAAAQRAMEFFLGWFADPVWKGDYPQVMKERAGGKLPAFTAEEKSMLKGSSDFFGLNTYSTQYAEQAEGAGEDDFFSDQGVALSSDGGWQRTDFDWAVVPWGCGKLLEWIRDRYDNPPVYITENGCSYDDAPGPDGRIRDTRRIAFYQSYLNACHQAISHGVNLKGYFAWSLLDNIEWAEGYSQRFGLVHVDRRTLGRMPKDSARWFMETVRANAIPESPPGEEPAATPQIVPA
jgi:beta-glucosidase